MWLCLAPVYEELLAPDDESLPDGNILSAVLPTGSKVTFWR